MAQEKLSWCQIRWLAAQEEVALVLSAFCTGHFIQCPKAEQPAGQGGHCASPTQDHAQEWVVMLRRRAPR